MRFFFPLVLVFTAIGLGIYGYLGGLRTPTVALQTTTAPVLLAGQPYVGKVQDQRFGELFRAAKVMQETGRLGAASTLANLYYNDPEISHDTIRAFIGLSVPDTARKLPVGWRYRVVPAGQRTIHARLEQVSFLLSPGKLYAAAEQELKAQKLRKQAPYLEEFGANEHSELWIGVK